MRPEILAPVGSMEALNAALAAGCDAVYFGLPSFGARAFANNFDLETTKEVIERCHLCGVKVYITMNTILYEDEMEDAYNMAKRVLSIYYIIDYQIWCYMLQLSFLFQTRIKLNN